MRGNWKIILFCFIMGIHTIVFGQENKIARGYYSAGEESLMEGVANLKRLKTLLNSFFVEEKLIKIGDIRKKDKISALSFIKELKRISDCNDERFKNSFPDFYSVELWSTNIKEKFNLARTNFGEAIKRDNTFVDAYLGKAIACVEMGDYEEALEAFKEIRKQGIEKIRVTPQNKSLIQMLFYTMADEVMKRRLTLSEGEKYEEWAKRVIEDFMNWQKKLGNLSEREELSNCFELVRFYTRHHKKVEAEKEYQKVEIKDWMATKYPGTIEEVKNGYENMKEISVTISDDLVKEFKKPVMIKFFRDDNVLSWDYLYLSFSSEGCFVEFKYEVSCECISVEQRLFIERQQNLPTCEITVPQIEIKKSKDNRDILPFCVAINNEVKTPTSFKMEFEGVPIKEYPGQGEKYEWKRDINNDWTIIQTITKQGDKTTYKEEEFKRYEKFTSNIIIKGFAGEKLEIKKTNWIPDIEWQRNFSALFIVIQVIAWGAL